MGGPKALLALRGEPLAFAHARRLGEAGFARVVLVVSPAIAPRLPPLPAGVTLALSSARDPAGSLAVGAAALDAGPGGTVDVAVIAPVDAAPADVATIAALVRAVHGGALAATPTLGGRGGHPVACHIDVIRALGTPPAVLRDALRALGERHARVPVDDPAVRTDLDTPEAWRAFAGEEPRFF